ncbi:MAG: carboxypeptidase regulatory-like domain-containing protein [Bacillota bacterium]|nr:carboxypeptidase regulatory-like domain-containing protein [Bacillota bacterium]MDW7684389.1 carboxypeptidase regulatory-like domain-containing protein [Bacillota bacterium]
MKKVVPILTLLLLTALLFLPAAYAHGVVITPQFNGTEVELLCTYDDGKILAGARIDVFAPNEPSIPYLQGETGQNGEFVFTPDTARPGEWVVRARLDGHGGMTRITIDSHRYFWSTFSTTHWLMVAATAAFTLAAVWLFILTKRTV